MFSFSIATFWLTVTQGGDTIWGNATDAPDDNDDTMHTHGELITFRARESESAENKTSVVGNMTAGDAESWILQHTPLSFQV